MNAIELQGIHKIFKPHKRPIVNALTDVDLTVATGDAVALTGHNGAGKTTLLKICATVITPNQGTGKVCGFPFKKHHDIRKHIGLLAADERSFYWRLTGRQNLHFFGALQNMSRRKVNERLEELADQFEVDYLDRRFDQCSTGMKQHIGLIRCLMHKPQLLLLDEPTRSLDIEATERFQRNMHDLVKKEGHTLLIVTHNHTLAHILCRRVIMVEEGRIVDERTSESVGVGTAPRFVITTDALSPLELRTLKGSIEVENVLQEPRKGRALVTTTNQPFALGTTLERIAGLRVPVYDCRPVEPETAAVTTAANETLPASDGGSSMEAGL